MNDRRRRTMDRGLAALRYLRIVTAAEFVELPPFDRHREHYLDDEAFRALQIEMLRNPAIGDVIPGSGGLRKMRVPDPRRRKGKRGGLRLIHFWWSAGSQFWLFTIYDKDEMADLTAGERRMLRKMLEIELDARRRT